MKLEDMIFNEIERMPNRFTDERQAEFLKYLYSNRSERKPRHSIRSLTVAFAGLVACGLLVLVGVFDRVPQSVTTPAKSTGETFGPKLIASIDDVARRDPRVFQVYIPTGGFATIKVPQLKGWASGANRFSVDISEKNTNDPLYLIDESSYSGPFDKSSFTKLGDIDGIAVYEHKFSTSVSSYSFRIGFTDFTVTVSSMSTKQQVTFPTQLLSHLVPYEPQGLAMPSTSKWTDDHTVNVSVPCSDAQSEENWRVVNDPGGLPAVQMSYNGKLMLSLSVPAINQKTITDYILVGGQTYLVSHIALNSDHQSGTMTLIRQTR